MKRQCLKMKACCGPVAACSWRPAVLFKHFYGQKFHAGFSAHCFVQSMVQVTNCLEFWSVINELASWVQPLITLFKTPFNVERRTCCDLLKFLVVGRQKTFETSLRSSCHFWRYFEVSGCGLHWGHIVKLIERSKPGCLFVGWLFFGPFFLTWCSCFVNVFGFVCSTTWAVMNQALKNGSIPFWNATI